MTAMSTMIPSHAMPIHASTPIRRFSKTSSGGSSTARAASTWPGVTSVSADSSATDPRIEHTVEPVHREVDDDVDDRYHCDVVLQCDVLPAVDGVGDREAEAVEMEDDLDDERATDQLTDVQARDGEQGEARGTERMAPEDAAV